MNCLLETENRLKVIYWFIVAYLFKSSPFAFLLKIFFCIVGDNWLWSCISSIAAELGVIIAEGTDVGVGIIGWVFGKVASLLTI